MIERARRAQKPRSGSVGAPRQDPPAGDAATAVEREQRRLERHRAHDRDDRDQEAGDPEHAHERERHRDQEGEPERDGEAGEDDRAARGLHRAHHRLGLGSARGELLPEAVDDQERVVDRDPEPDQLDEVRRVGGRDREVGHPVDDPERRGDRARGEEQRDRHRPRQAEDGEQHEQRDRQREEELAVAEVALEDRIEVVLDRPGTGHVHAPGARRAPERAQHRLGVRLRLRDVETRDDVGEEDVPPAGGQRRRLGGGDDRRGMRERSLQPRHELRIGRVGDPEDDRERTVRPIAEVRLEQLPHVLGVGSRHREGVREERREPRAREAAGQEDHDPDGDHAAAVPQHESRPPAHGEARVNVRHDPTSGRCSIRRAGRDTV